MIEQFIAHLRRLDPEATPAEIADILWLAARMGEAEGDAGPRSISSEPAEKETPSPEDSAPGSRETGEAEEPREPSAPMYPRTAAGTGLGGAGGLGGEAIGSPGVPALPGRLELVRALRPLKRRVGSRRFQEVDIRATAERMAETKLPWPVTRPLPERWLDLILVEEVSPTMRIWRPVVRELARLLRGAGVFRRVVRRKTALGSMEDGGKGSSDRLGVATAPERTLVLVVSDGVSAPWWNGEAARTLERWGWSAMTALVQMFPEHLWDRTGLGRAEKVRVRFPFPGAVGRSVLPIRPFAGFDLDELEDDEVETGMANPPAVLPVFPLESAYVRDWATALSGTGAFPPVGFLLEPSSREGEIEMDDGERESLDLDAQIRRFLSISSPAARRLCGYLAAVPLVFPVMRLVQGVMLPDSRQHHLAEVMLSGLVYRKTPRGEDKPDDEILYDFLEGARERLVGLNRIPDALDVLSVVNEKLRAFLDEKTGRAFDFRALVGAPDGRGVSIGTDELGFAKISATVLGRMGGRYREIAEWVAGMAEDGGDTPGVDGRGTEEEAEPKPGDILEITIFGTDQTRQTLRFAFIPPGEFMMGSPEDEPGRWDDESPLHRVRITRGFYMQTTPVTQAQWEAVMGKNPSGFKEAGPNAPVERVSWEDIQMFLQKVNPMTGSERFRLPTEAEWEYACRAGTETAFYNGPITEPSGHDPNLDKVGWFDENSGSTTHPVGQKEPNAWGLYDMHGNVWEWCSDWFDEKYYAKSPPEDPQGPESGAGRVNRGGAWLNDAGFCRAAYRGRYTPDYRSIYLGFRLLAERQVRRFKSSSS